MFTYCALAVLVTNEFSASRCTGHENIVLVDHEIREVQIYQTFTKPDMLYICFLINKKYRVSVADRTCYVDIFGI